MLKVTGGVGAHKKLKMDDDNVESIVQGSLLKDTASGVVMLGTGDDAKDAGLNGRLFISLDSYANCQGLSGKIGVMPLYEGFDAKINVSHAGEAVTAGKALTVRGGLLTIADETGDFVVAVAKDANSSTATDAEWNITTRCFKYVVGS